MVKYEEIIVRGIDEETIYRGLRKKALEELNRRGIKPISISEDFFKEKIKGINYKYFYLKVYYYED